MKIEDIPEHCKWGWRATVAPSILGFAGWLWFLDITNLDVWCSERFAHFINLVIARVN